MPLVLDDNFARNYWGLVEACGGTQDQVFDQGSYIALNRLGRNVEGGVCLALSMVWNACGGSDGTFFDYINTGDGIGKVRGTQLLYQMRLRGNIDVGLSGMDEVKDGIRVAGRKLVKKIDGGKNGLTNMTEVNKVIRFISQSAQYQLHFWGKGGHAIAFKTNGLGQVKVFDPNAGMATFQSPQAVGTFLRNMLETNYNDLNRRWCCARITR